MWFHAEHRRWSHDESYLNPRRPEVIIYADVPAKPLVLVGVMFSMPRGLRGPTPGGPITRWHWHRVCAKGDKRGLTPRADGSCPAGATMRNGSEMMHVWFTYDLRSGYAIHAPEHDLCVARKIPRDRCGDAHGHRSQASTARVSAAWCSRRSASKAASDRSSSRSSSRTTPSARR